MWPEEFCDTSPALSSSAVTLDGTHHSLRNEVDNRDNREPTIFIQGPHQDLDQPQQICIKLFLDTGSLQ